MLRLFVAACLACVVSMEASGQYDPFEAFGRGGSLDRAATALEGTERALQGIENSIYRNQRAEEQAALQLRERYMAEMRAELAANNANQLYRIAFTLNESNQDLRRDIMRLKNEVARLEREKRTQTGRANAAVTELRQVQEEAGRRPIAELPKAALPTATNTNSKQSFIDAMKGEFPNLIKDDGVQHVSASMVRLWDEWVNDNLIENPKDLIPWVIIIRRDELIGLAGDVVPKRPAWLK